MQLLSEALLERLQNRQAILVAGLGCSELGVLPGWRALASALAERVADEAERQAISEMVRTNQLSTALAVLRATLPEAELEQILQGLLPVRGQAPDAIKAVANAPWRGIIATGLDSLWTAALANVPDLADRMVFANGAASLGAGHGRFLLQLFGRPDVPPTLCLAPFEIGPKVVATGAAKFLQGLHRKWSFVFAGFSPSDPDLALLAGRVLANSASTLEHFFVAPGLSTMDARRVKAEFGLTGVPADGTIEDVLSSLARACELASDKSTDDDVEASCEASTAEPFIDIDKLKDFDAALATARSLAASDPAAAEKIYAKCLDRDPQNASALLALSDLARDKGDHLRAVKFLLDAAEQTPNPLELGRLFTEAGSIYLDRLSDEGNAVEFFLRALAADPEQTAAAGRLLPLREKAEDWAAAEPLVDLLLRKIPDDGSSAKCELYQRQAHNARKQGKVDKALAALEAASKLDRRSPTLALEYADLLFERQRWAEARVEYERARDLPGAGSSAQQRAALYEKLGACAIQADALDDAVRYYNEALALEPAKRSTLETQIDLRTAREEWKEQVALKRKLLEQVADNADRARILDEIGYVLQERLGDPATAMKAYLEALGLQPERRQTLFKTLDHYTQEGQWTAAVATLQKLAGLEDEPGARAKLNYAMAAIHRDEMKDTAKAVELFSKVLDDNPLYPKAFDAIEKLLGDAKEWKALERAYRGQIERLPAGAPQKLRMWDALAEAELKQHDRENAAQTMEVAATLDPDNVGRQERLASLYFSMGPSAVDKAIDKHQALVAKKPDRIDSYKALAALFFQTGAHDKMWCVAGAMTCLGKADPPLQAIYENFRPTQTAAVPGKLTDDLWRKLAHPDDNPYLGALFSLLSPALAMTTAQPHMALGLDRQARIDLAGANWPYAAALRYVASTIEAPLPDVFIKRDAPGTITLVNLKDQAVLAPALIIGLGFEQLTSQSQVVFDLAKRMVQLRPERFPRITLGTPAALDTAIRAGMHLAGSPMDLGEHRDEVEKLAKQLDASLSGPLRLELKVLAKKYSEACGDKLDIEKWIVASDLTASRAALALCGDIVSAARVLTLEPSGQSPLPVADRINDLLAYFVSDAHFAVRAALGLQVNLTPPAATDPQPKRRMSHMQIKTEG